jgi:X-X-X-Leu-X-X-Gly heptad repeat protein
MELFIPGLCLFLLVIGISFAIIPKFSPLVIAILSIIVLVITVRHHYSMFESEYRLSTWQESLKVYAPAIMIIAMILFIIYNILSMFTSGSVPVPPLPTINTASPESTTNQIMNSLTNVASSVKNVATNVVEGVSNQVNTGINKINQGINKINQGVNQGINRGNQNKGNQNRLSKSFLEII